MEVTLVMFTPNPAIGDTWRIPVAAIVDGVYVEAELLPNADSIGGESRYQCMMSELSNVRESVRWHYNVRSTCGPHITLKLATFRDGTTTAEIRKATLASPSYHALKNEPWVKETLNALFFAFGGGALVYAVLFVLASG